MLTPVGVEQRTEQSDTIVLVPQDEDDEDDFAELVDFDFSVLDGFELFKDLLLSLSGSLGFSGLPGLLGSLGLVPNPAPPTSPPPPGGQKGQKHEGPWIPKPPVPPFHLLMSSVSFS